MLQLNPSMRKIKASRTQFIGVRNVEYFLYRLTNLYA